MDYIKALNYFASLNLVFDVIFLDPPYATDFITKSIFSIVDNHLLAQDGIIVCESDSLERIDVPLCLKIVKSKKYGDKVVAILQYV